MYSCSYKSSSAYWINRMMNRVAHGISWKHWSEGGNCIWITISVTLVIGMSTRRTDSVSNALFSQSNADSCAGIEQTRGWFYSLKVLTPILLINQFCLRSQFQLCLSSQLPRAWQCNGTVLAADVQVITQLPCNLLVIHTSQSYTAQNSTNDFILPSRDFGSLVYQVCQYTILLCTVCNCRIHSYENIDMINEEQVCTLKLKFWHFNASNVPKYHPTCHRYSNASLALSHMKCLIRWIHLFKSIYLYRWGAWMATH